MQQILQIIEQYRAMACQEKYVVGWRQNVVIVSYQKVGRIMAVMNVRKKFNLMLD